MEFRNDSIFLAHWCKLKPPRLLVFGIFIKSVKDSVEMIIQFYKWRESSIISMEQKSFIRFGGLPDAGRQLKINPWIICINCRPASGRTESFLASLRSFLLWKFLESISLGCSMAISIKRIFRHKSSPR